MAASSRGSAVLLAGRRILSLAVPVCCLLLLVLVPRLPELAAGRLGIFPVSVGQIVGSVARWSSPPEREEIADVPPPPPPEREVIIVDTSPPPLPELPTRSEVIIVDASSPPPTKLEEETIDASPPPPPLEPQARTEPPTPSSPPTPAPMSDPCAGRYIYIQELPSRFNADLLRDCRTLLRWTDMCKYVANAGMGPPLTRTGGVLPPTGWYDTNQFTLEVIFHHRMRQYGCLTSDASLAAAVYLPYYAGLDVGRHLFGPFGNAARDALAEDLGHWLRSSSPAWAARGGLDHFLVAGRIAWDFRRAEGGEWGSRLLHLPEVANMTALVLEAAAWHASDVSVPYPTYFHPSSRGGAEEVAAWQRELRRAPRPWLFAFAGAPRGPGGAGTLSNAVMEQCARSPRLCGMMQCGDAPRNDCSAPANVMRLFKSAAFCLQPPGDSYTRRSAFDAMLAGCVPVFFHPASAYTQYRWHLPADHATYSVLVPEENGVRNGSLRVEDVLRRFAPAEVAAMREQVIRLVPRIVYRDPTTGGGAGGFRDAVDIAVDGVIERVKRNMRGLPPSEEEDVYVHRR